MAIPTYVLEAIADGKEYLSNMNEDLREDFLRGCACKPENQKILERVIVALDGKVELDEFDDSAEANLNILYSIVGSGSIPVDKVGYYGSKTIGQVLTYSQIVASSQFTFTSGGSMVVPFNNNQFLDNWFAYPDTEPEKNYYNDVIVPFKEGNMGTDQDLYGASQIVAGAVNLRLHQQVYPTPQPNSMEFKTI